MLTRYEILFMSKCKQVLLSDPRQIFTAVRKCKQQKAFCKTLLLQCGNQRRFLPCDQLIPNYDHHFFVGANMCDFFSSQKRNFLANMTFSASEHSSALKSVQGTFKTDTLLVKCTTLQMRNLQQIILIYSYPVKKAT